MISQLLEILQKDVVTPHLILTSTVGFSSRRTEISIFFSIIAG
jgi:hypothetical protein